MAPTHRGCALVSVTKHHHRQFLSADRFHHGLLAGSAVALASLCHISFCHLERSRGTPDFFPRPLLCVILIAAKDPGSFSLPRPCDTCESAGEIIPHRAAG